MTRPALHVRSAPEPAMRAGEHGPQCSSAVTGVTLRAAGNLAEHSRFHGQPAEARLEAALDEQRAFLSALLAPDADVVYDLRLISRPDQDSALAMGILVRSWASSDEAAETRVLNLADSVLRGAPDHVVLAPATEAELALLLDPIGGSAEAPHATFITRDEVTGRPMRPDVRSRVDYHYAVLPWSSAATDWRPIYARLQHVSQPIALSVALMPRRTDPSLAEWLDAYATQYRQWATPHVLHGALYSGERTLPPEPFAIDAAPVFAEFARRLRTRCFAIRILLASSEPLPPGLADAIGATISGGVRDLEGHDASTGYALRDRDTRALAAWDLAAVDVCTPTGEPRIWEVQYPPPSSLADLAMIGDVRDAGCAFRLPILADPRCTGARGTGQALSGAPRVFLCHSSANKTAVRALYRRLVDDGFSPWLDEEDLLAGEDWELAIARAVRDARFVVVLLSHASTTRAGFVHKEVKQALDVADRQPEGTIFVIPARLEECIVPNRLEHLHRVDLFAGDGYLRLTRVLRRGAQDA